MGSVLFDVGAERCPVDETEATQLALRLNRLGARHIPGDAEAAAEALRDALRPARSAMPVIALTREQAVAVVSVIDRWLAEGGVVSVRLLELRRALRSHFRIADGDPY